MLSTISLCVHQLSLHPQASAHNQTSALAHGLVYQMLLFKYLCYPLCVWQYAQAELCAPTEQRVELIASTGVYVTLPQLEEACREAKNGTQLARKLMEAFWDRETLARSSLSSKSKYQYQQLDPNVISAIEGIYCSLSLSLFFCSTFFVVAKLLE